MSELKRRHINEVMDMFCLTRGDLNWAYVYYADDADKVIAELKADYKEACDRLQTANLIADEQKTKADKLLSCLKCLVMRDLIKDCPEKESTIEIVKEYENGLG